MSELSFQVTAQDQASQVVASVQKKVADFGKDVGKQIAGVLGPIAALQWGIGKVSEYMEDLARKNKEAFDWGASLSDNAAKLGVTVEQFQQISDAADATGLSVDKVAMAFKLSANLIEQAKNGSSDAAKSLEAMGINIENIDQTKPQDVLKALAAALNLTVDPAERAQIAIAALGQSAKDLQETLAKGFDIARAFESTAGLTPEEADFLHEKQMEEKAKENKKKLVAAREQSLVEFRKTKEGKAFIEQNSIIAGYDENGVPIMVEPSKAAQSDELSRVEKQKKDAAEAARIAALTKSKEGMRAETTKTSLINKFKDDVAEEERRKESEKRAKEKGEAKPESYKFKTEKLEKPDSVTVSSLRQIGGGLSGEIATAADVSFQIRDEMKSVNDTLRRIETKLVPPPNATNFIKNPLLGGDQQFIPGQNTPGPVRAGFGGTAVA